MIEGNVAYLGTAHWSRLLEAGSDESAFESWLALLCGQLQGVRRAVVVARRGPFRPVAFWPEGQRTSKFLMETVNAALGQGRDTIREDAETGVVGLTRIVTLHGQPQAVVGVELESTDQAQRQETLRRLQWGAAWLELFERRRTGDSEGQAIERLALALDALAVAGEQTGFRAAALAALTSLAVQMSAARVSLGFTKGRAARVVSISNTTKFDRRVQEVRDMAQAMDEAIDQGRAISYPTQHEDATTVALRAKALSNARGSGEVIVQPFFRDGRVRGAMVFEWADDEAPPAHVREAVGDVVALLAPLLEDRWAEERYIVTRAVQSVGRGLAAILGPGHLGGKIGLLAAAAMVAFFILFTVTFHVSANASLRGAIERVVAAPIDGYILEAPPRAGDRVAEGDLLVQFDDAEYRLELFSWTARKHQYETEYLQALAERDRAAVNMLKAQTEEADAQIRLNETRIDLARIEAPLAGVIVSGDQSQSLGQSVQRGEEMFRLAPLDSYIVEIEVPEADILEIEVGAHGHLVLASMPTVELRFDVERITPVMRAEEGVNAFVVEARLEAPGNVSVAPGMEGVAKIEAGERRLIWIWTRRAIDWLRLAWWRWSP